MKRYRCTVFDKQGRRQTMVQDAANPDSLLLDLHRANLTVIEFSEVSPGEQQVKVRRLSSRQVLAFTNHFNTLLSSGLDVKHALQICRENTRNPSEREFLDFVNAHVQKGASLSLAMSHYARSFGPLYLGLVSVGEKIGNLEPVIGRLAAYLQTMKQLRDKIIGALMYPLLVLVVAIVGIILLMIFVIPMLLEIAGAFSKTAGTAYVAQIAAFQSSMSVVAIVVAALVVLMASLIVMTRRNLAFRERVHRWTWQLPLIRLGVRTSTMLFFSFAMETLLQSGYTLDEAMSQAAKASSNLYFRTMVESMRRRLSQGERINHVAASTKGLPSEFSMWVGIGEQTGTLTSIFGQLRVYYQSDLEKKSQLIMSLVEPVLIVIVGIVLLALIQTVITPLFGMMGNLL